MLKLAINMGIIFLYFMQRKPANFNANKTLQFNYYSNQ